MDARILTSEFCLRRYLFCLTLPLLALTQTKLAVADTYTAYPTVTLGYGRGTLLGLTATGVQISYVPYGCPGSMNQNCAQLFDPNSGATSYSTDYPFVATFDSGSACAPTTVPPGFFGGVQAVCNGTHQVIYGSSDKDSPYRNAIYLDPSGPRFEFDGGQISNVEVDSLGDVSFNFFSSGPLAPDHVYGFIDTTNHPIVTPEPSSIALFCTGLTGIFAASRRRRIQ